MASVDLSNIRAEITALNGNGLSVYFDGDVVDLPEASHDALSDIAEQMKANPDMTLRLIGYAAQIGDQQTQSRRVSLFRALAVRARLLKEGVDKRRMSVQALGTKTDGSGRSQNRVDLVLSTG